MAAAPPRDEPTERDLPHRPPALDPALYNAVFIRLMAAALFFFVVILAAAYFYVAPLGHGSSRAVVPVLARYLDAGVAGDVLAAHALYSTAAMRAKEPRDVALDFGVRPHFDGYQRLQVSRFGFVPGAGPGGMDQAEVEASVFYDQEPAGALRARLVYEEDRWRIAFLEVTRGGR